MKIVPTDPKDYDFKLLNRQLDKVKSKVFMGTRAAFFAPLMCSTKFMWTHNVQTAATDGEFMFWNPEDFLRCSDKSKDATMVHELWHIARLHPVRGEGKQHKVWNQAIDYKVNLDLKDEGFVFTEETPVLLDERWRNWAEEPIYFELMKNPPPQGPGGPQQGNALEGDLIPITPGSKLANINAVVSAMQQATMAGQPGTIPGGLREMVNNFLQPVIRWDVVLHKFFKDLLNWKSTWRRPNRRHHASGLYLPSTYQDRGKLDHVVFFEDVSGSVTKRQALRMNSEVAHIWARYKPKKLTIVQFDTKIQRVDVLEKREIFTEIEIIGRGGTDLDCVRRWINDEKPTAVVVMSDMFCNPMAAPDIEVPIIWAVVGNPNAQVPFGTMIHMEE